MGGFGESQWLQHELRLVYNPRGLKVIVPLEPSVAVLKGAVLFGLEPSLVAVRRSRYTYGIAALNRFDTAQHPGDKLVVRDGVQFCKDILDVFVRANQPVQLGDAVVRHYVPARRSQRLVLIKVYAAELESVRFVDSPGVIHCGALALDVSDLEADAAHPDAARPTAASPVCFIFIHIITFLFFQVSHALYSTK